MASVVRVDDLADAVARWTVLTGTSPSFVDGERWAQFDTPVGRIALASAAEVPQGSGVMFKVRNLEAVRERLVATQMEVGEIETGGHEHRFALVADGVSVIYYASA